MEEPKLTPKQIRTTLRKKGIPVTRTMIGARIKCRRDYHQHGNIHWAFKEEYGYVILNITTKELYNHGRKKNRMKILRVRDLDRMCVHRYPRKGWMKMKSKKA